MADYDEGQVFDRDYVDNFSVKDLAVNTIMPKYFPDDTSHLTVGLEGMIGEYVGVTTEDAFNAASTYLMETFPTRAQFSSSIYANAAIFQLTNAFATASTCDFLIILSESDIKRNFIQSSSDKYLHFYIDKDTKFYVEDLIYTFDYDIDIKAKYIKTVNGTRQYMYSAKYLMPGQKIPDDHEFVYKNSISTLNDPYIKVRLSKNGLIALQVTMKQYSRTYQYNDLNESSSINYPVFSINHDGYIAGFEVLYRSPTETEFNTQLAIQPMFSNPTREPFCYYKKVDDNTIKISFTTKDGYWQPEFNSEVKIVIYDTDGADGNFDEYTGDDISISKNSDFYQYDYSWTITTKPMSSSYGGADPMSKDALKDLTVEGFSTANALTTNHDLELYFNNFKHRYGSEVLFLKKRDDAVERLFSAFLYVKEDDYFYPTNTLTLNTNILDLDYKVGGFYNMDPGFLFGYETTEVYYTPIKYWDTIDPTSYYARNEYGEIIYYRGGEVTKPQTSIDEETLQDMIKAEDLIEGKQEWYQVSSGGYALFNEDGIVTGDYASTITENDLLGLFRDGKVKYGRIEGSSKNIEFLVDVEKEATDRLNYIKYKDTYAELNGYNSLTLSSYVFLYSFNDYKTDNGIDTKLSVFDSDLESKIAGKSFVFTNPFLMSIIKSSGLVGYYMTYISQDSTLDFYKQNDDDAFVQFITYTLHVKRNIGNERKFNISLTVLPTVSIENEEEMIVHENIYDVTATADNSENSTVNQFIRPTNGDELVPSMQNYNKELLERNYLRVILSFYSKDDNKLIGYMEMIPTDYQIGTDQVTFEAEFETDDFITSNNTFRVVHRCPYCGNVILNSANHNIKNREYFCPECSNTFKEGIINVQETDDILLPIDNALVGVTILYQDPTESYSTITNNEFAQYDDTYTGYHWTNVYESIMDPITFIEPLNMVRGTIEYQDYYLTGINAMDCYLYDIPMLKYSVIAYKDEGMEVTDPLLSDDIGKFYYFMKDFKLHYDFLADAKNTLRNATNIDTKFYNTYGRSTNFVIGDGDNELYIDTNNISIHFEVAVITNTDILEAETELKMYIKEYIETINSDGTNSLYISNLITAIENDFAYVHHLKFRGINDYDTSYQSIKNIAISLDNLSKAERRHFVPELLVINRNNIFLDISEQD